MIRTRSRRRHLQELQSASLCLSGRGLWELTHIVRVPHTTPVAIGVCYFLTSRRNLITAITFIPIRSRDHGFTACIRTIARRLIDVCSEIFERAGGTEAALGLDLCCCHCCGAEEWEECLLHSGCFDDGSDSEVGMMVRSVCVYVDCVLMKRKKKGRYRLK